jgi:signal transduction histidine kinase
VRLDWSYERYPKCQWHQARELLTSLAAFPLHFPPEQDEKEPDGFAAELGQDASVTDLVALPTPYGLRMRRLFWVPLGLASLVVLAVLAGLVAVSWRGLERIRPVEAHLAHISRIQDLGLNMEQTLVEGLRGARIEPEQLALLRKDVGEIAVLDGQMHPLTRERLHHVARLLGGEPTEPVDVLFETLAEVRTVLDAEQAHHELLWTQVARNTETELRLAVALFIVLPLAGGALLLLLRVRVKRPLDNLGVLLERLAARDYRPVADSALNDASALVQPVFRSYNELVSRLRALESGHRARENTLEREVRQATEALLSQSRELARAERLAAVGAVSAGLAHELRNPLAGIQMACSKLRRNLQDKSQAARAEAVIAELKRLNGLLTEQVEAARYRPEAPTKVHLAALVGDLLTLVRYQAPQGTRLLANIPWGMECMVPQAGLRQALLNLLLNAIQVQEGDGQVTVVARHGPGQLLLWVEDEGPGFPEDMLRTGVRPFATGRAGGTGLGLAMVRRFTRDHGGEMELSNREGRGARVTLHLPCTAAGAGDEGHG